MNRKEEETHPVASQALSTSIFSFLTGQCYKGASEELTREVFSGVLENVDLPRLTFEDARFLLEQVCCNRSTVIKCLDNLIGRCNKPRRCDGEEGPFTWLAIDYSNSSSSRRETRLSSAADLEKVWSMLNLLLHALRFGNVDGVHVDFGCSTSATDGDLFSPITDLLQLGVRSPTLRRSHYSAQVLPLNRESECHSYDWFADSVYCIIQYAAQHSPHLLGLANKDGKAPLHFAVVSCFSGDEVNEGLEHHFRNCDEISKVTPQDSGSRLIPTIIQACPDSALIVDNNGNSALHVLIDFLRQNSFYSIPLSRFHVLLRACPHLVSVPRRDGCLPLLEILVDSDLDFASPRACFVLIGMLLQACCKVPAGTGTDTCSDILDMLISILQNFDKDDSIDEALYMCIEQMTSVFEIFSSSRESVQADAVPCLFKGLDAIACFHSEVESYWEDVRFDNFVLVRLIKQFASRAVVYDSGESGLASLQMPNNDCGASSQDWPNDWVFRFTSEFSYGGRHLLHTTAATSSPIVLELAHANPDIISRKDPTTGLYPFQAAASTGDLAGLSNAYLLLKENPSAMSALTGGRE